MNSLDELFFNHFTIEGMTYEDILDDVQKYCTANHVDTPSGEADPEQAKKPLKEFIPQYLIKCSYGVEGMSSTELCENLHEDTVGFLFLKKWIYQKGVEGANINVYNDIEVITSGGRSVKIPERSQSPQYTIDVTRRLSSTCGTMIDDTIPSVIGYLDKNIRASVDKTPIINASVGINASIRIVNQQSISREKPTDLGFAIEEMLDLPVCCTRYGVSVCITDSAGSGKTTVMSWPLSMVPDNRRLITTEEGSRESDLVKRDVDGKILNSVIHLPTRPHENPASNIDQDTPLECVLRKYPDVIGVGEMCSAKEALPVAESSRIGHTVVTTIHSNSVEATYRRTMVLAKRKHNMADDILTQIIVEAYPVVISTKQLEDDSRKIMQIIEGEDHIDGKFQYRILYQYNVEDNRTIAGKVQVFGEHKKLNPFTDNLKKRLLDDGIFQLELKKLMDERREPRCNGYRSPFLYCS